MPIYRDKRTGRWRFDFDRRIHGKRLRRRQLLPSGWTRSQADAFDRKEGSALSALAEGIARPRRTIDEAVTRYVKERIPALKAGENAHREIEWMQEWYAGRAIEELPEVCAEYAEDQDGALAPATIKNRIAYLRAACRFAWKRHRLCEHDPGARVVSPTVRNAREVYLTREQMLRLARECTHRAARAMIRIAWYSGMRLGEIERAEAVGGVFRLADTKNGESRVVPIHPRIAVCVRRYRCPSRYTFGYHFRKARKAVGMDDVHAHDLRHSAASELRRAGVDLHTVGKVLGHKSSASTMRYAHLGVDALAEAIGKMGRMVKKFPTAPGGKKAA